MELQQNEQIILESTASFLKSKIQAIPGKLILTNQRFIFKPSKLFFASIAGIIGLIFGKKNDQSFNRSEIQQAWKTTFGLNNKVLSITIDGKEFKYIVDKNLQSCIEELGKKGF